MQQREIRFRAYHPELKKMWSPELRTAWEMLRDATDAGAIVMQFTGLKDKAGVDIYEGDVVNYAVKKRLCNCKDETDLFLGINKFCPNCGKEVTNKDFVTTCKIDFRKGSFVLHTDHDNGYYQAWPTYIAEVYIEWLEVIGNIHQHPELLKP